MGHQSHDDFSQKNSSGLHPYLMYFVGNSARHREQHLAWNGLILPKDDPFWNNHFPPNSYGCKCFTRTVSEPKKRRYEREEIKIPPKADGSGGRIQDLFQRTQRIYRAHSQRHCAGLCMESREDRPLRFRLSCLS